MKSKLYRKVKKPLRIAVSALLIVLFAGQSVGCGMNPLSSLDSIDPSELTNNVLSKEDNGNSASSSAETSKEDPKDKAYRLMIQGRDYLNGFSEDGYSQEKATQCLNQAAELGNAEAWYYLGNIYERSADTDRFEQAMACYDKAIELGAAIGYDGKGDLYLGGYGVEEDIEKAHKLYQQAADNGCLHAYASLGYDYIYGYGVGKDHEKAMECINAALESDDPYTVSAANVLTGYLYEAGYNGAEPDYGKAMEYYRTAADNGYRSGMRKVAQYYYNGTGVDQDYQTALKWYEKAADLGLPSAMTTIGGMYRNGRGVEKDLKKAFSYYERAAALGDAAAMIGLSRSYCLGEGTDKDYVKSMDWAKNALIGGDTDAYFRIGFLYSNGYGVEKNEDIALEYYAKAADEKNDLNAMWNALRIYNNRSDYVNAQAWAERGLYAAKEKGNQEFIKDFEDQNLRLIWNNYVTTINSGDRETAKSWAARGLDAATKAGNQEYIDKFNNQLSKLQ